MSDELQTCEIINIDDQPVVFVVDHASSFIPQDYDNLGLDAKTLKSHIAIDIGARDMCLGLLDRLGGRAVLAGFSRLLIDPNRELWRHNLVPSVSDDVEISGNKNLSEKEIKKRIDRFYSPFHAAVEGEVAALLQKDIQPLVVGIHSFTPVMDGFTRPWHVGLMWNKDSRLGLALAQAFAEQGHNVGHNLPYGGDDLFHTMMSHGAANHLPHTQIEVRQDLVNNKGGADHWAELIAQALNPFLEKPELLQQFTEE